MLKYFKCNLHLHSSDLISEEVKKQPSLTNIEICLVSNAHFHYPKVAKKYSNKTAREKKVMM